MIPFFERVAWWLFAVPLLIIGAIIGAFWFNIETGRNIGKYAMAQIFKLPMAFVTDWVNRTWPSQVQK